MAILTYVLRTKTTVVMDRHMETHRMFHLESDSGLTKFELSPEGGGRAGSMLINVNLRAQIGAMFSTLFPRKADAGIQTLDEAILR